MGVPQATCVAIGTSGTGLPVISGAVGTEVALGAKGDDRRDVARGREVGDAVVTWYGKI